jgi:hypothetical protein
VNNIETNASVYEGSIVKCIVHYYIIGNRTIEEKKVIEGGKSDLSTKYKSMKYHGKTSLRK